MVERFRYESRYIPIQPKLELDYLLLGAGVALPIGTVFMNSDLRDGAQYVVTKIGDRLGIVKKAAAKLFLMEKLLKMELCYLEKLKE